MSSKMINALKAMYSIVKSVIKFNHNLSDPFSIHQGVKQGDSSSSLLFMMFVNDMLENINTDLDGLFTIDELKLFLILYADDQILFATSPNSLQHMLTDIEAYCNASKLKINTAKTKVLIFEKGTHYTNIDIFLYGEN